MPRLVKQIVLREWYRIIFISRKPWSSHTHLQATQASPQAKACKRVCLPHAKTNLIFSPPTADTLAVGQKQRKPILDRAWQWQWTEGQLVKAVLQKSGFSAPQTHLWLNKVWFSASTFVVKIATFAKPKPLAASNRRNQSETINSNS